MKKILILLLFIAGTMTANAQIKSDSSLLKKNTTMPVVKNINVKPTSPVFTPPLKITKGAIGNLQKERDLVIDQFQVTYEPMNKRYKLKCRILNAGTTDIDLNLLSYFAYGSPNTLCTLVSQSDPGFRLQSGPVQINIPFNVEAELPAGQQVWLNGRNRQLMSNGHELLITTRDPNAGWIFSTMSNTILKPGEAAYAIAFDNAVWDSNITGAPQSRMYTIKIDPLNKIGDQDLSNNTITHTMTNYY